ncbi:hypothetical protein DB31_8021 [Hyalangium minutum]|uniref:Uncharacterized protein n=1 Tax=Hyalangium minutum TaxID=394096 RepID=A0A085WIM5_9BACT|nr:hypothetical protein DB31_8021 [Hyalangium minutum]
MAPARDLASDVTTTDMRSPEIPHRLGWLNSWSTATAQAIGFPTPACDAELLTRARRKPSGG